MLRGDAQVPTLSIYAGTSVTPAAGTVYMDYRRADMGFDLAFSLAESAPRNVEAIRITFDFNPRTSATTVLPARIEEDSTFHLPAIVSSPGFGQMLVTGPPQCDVTSRLTGSRSKKLIDWTVDIPVGKPAEPVRLSFRPILLAPPQGLRDEARWKQVRRAWFNVFQVSAQWGDPANPVSAPSGVLANNVISDPVSCCLFIYADSALWTPDPAEGVSLMRLVGHTLDWWLGKRMLESGEVPGYWKLTNFLDANPSLLISAWDYFEVTQDRQWLADRIERLEKAAAYLESRDIDHDGLLEAVQSGNAGTLKEPLRSCSGYDAVNCGYKDAYSNALAYRALRCLAELEGRLQRTERSQHYSQLADRLKASFAKELLNPQTGLVGMWRSQDGVLHDYAAPFVNALAIEYGLVDQETANQILDRLAAQFEGGRFERYDLGIPCTLLPVRREDYLLGKVGTVGIPAQEDGSDTFGQYLNGGIITGDSVRYLAALYTVGRDKQADQLLDRMLERIGHGDVPAGGFPISIVDHYPDGGEFWTWDGHTCGYEGLLSHAWHFTQAVTLREPQLRERIHRPLRAK